MTEVVLCHSGKGAAGQLSSCAPGGGARPGLHSVAILVGCWPGVSRRFNQQMFCLVHAVCIGKLMITLYAVALLPCGVHELSGPHCATQSAVRYSQDGLWMNSPAVASSCCTALKRQHSCCTCRCEMYLPSDEPPGLYPEAEAIIDACRWGG